MSEARLLCFHNRSEAKRWQDALDATGLNAKCVVYDEAYLDEKYGWQPPMWKWFDLVNELGETMEVFAIDGSWERTNRLIDISEGGTGAAYENTIPPGRIYVEAVNDESQYDPKLVAEHHELREYNEIMRDPDVVYEEAHGIATREERLARKAYEDPRVERHPGKRGE